MSRLTRAFYSPRVFDVVFAVFGLIAFAVLALGSGKGAAAIAPSDDPLRTGLAVAGLTLAVAIVGCFGTILDQRFADELVFQTLTKAAAVGLFTFFLATALWATFFARSMGALPAETMPALALLGFSIGYFFTRVRGTRA